MALRIKLAQKGEKTNKKVDKSARRARHIKTFFYFSGYRNLINSESGRFLSKFSFCCSKEKVTMIELYLFDVVFILRVLF